MGGLARMGGTALRRRAQCRSGPLVLLLTGATNWRRRRRRRRRRGGRDWKEPVTPGALVSKVPTAAPQLRRHSRDRQQLHNSIIVLEVGCCSMTLCDSRRLQFVRAWSAEGSAAL